MPIKKDEETLAKNTPHIVVGTPGRLLALGRTGQLKLKNIKFFVLDECDKMIGDAGESEFDLIKIIYFLLDMRHDVQEIFKMTPQEKQVMMFSATLPRELRVVCKKFMQEVSHLLKKKVFVLLLLCWKILSGLYLNFRDRRLCKHYGKNLFCIYWSGFLYILAKT